MKKQFLFLFLLFLASCATMNQLNNNMSYANELMYENIQSMEISRQAIEENTKEIQRSTETMRYIFPIVSALIVAIFIFLLYKLIKKTKK
jgi:hypothetical protein